MDEAHPSSTASSNTNSKGRGGRGRQQGRGRSRGQGQGRGRGRGRGRGQGRGQAQAAARHADDVDDEGVRSPNNNTSDNRKNNPNNNSSRNNNNVGEAAANNKKNDNNNNNTNNPNNRNNISKNNKDTSDAADKKKNHNNNNNRNKNANKSNSEKNNYDPQANANDTPSTVNSATENSSTSGGNNSNNNKSGNKKKNIHSKKQKQQNPNEGKEENQPQQQPTSTNSNNNPGNNNNNNNNNNRNNNNNKDSVVDNNNKNKKKQRKGRKRGGNQSSSSNNKRILYSDYWNYQGCYQKYLDKDENLIRGRLRVMPGGAKNERKNNDDITNASKSFCTCDRGSIAQDVFILGEVNRNRALDGDTVYVQLLPFDEDDEQDHDDNSDEDSENNNDDDTRDKVHNKNEEQQPQENAVAAEPATDTWQDDPIQVQLWNPLMVVPRVTAANKGDVAVEQQKQKQKQRKGRVVYVEPPKSLLAAGTNQPSEINPSAPTTTVVPNPSGPPPRPRRVIVGTIKILQSGTCLLTPNSRSLPQFQCRDLSRDIKKEIHEQMDEEKKRKDNENPAERKKISRPLYQAEYVYGTWEKNHQWPPCINVKCLGYSFSIQDEIKALLIEYNVDHGEDFPALALRDVETTVQSGLYVLQQEQQQTIKTQHQNAVEENEMGWKPTEDMYRGRRDLRKERIFTIDPTTAKDLDDALHIKRIPGHPDLVEIGVHIADVSYFVQPETNVDKEAQNRATTVYLVDRTIPMLPRPLCEIACSLNENVERLAFSCIWTMNVNGTMDTTTKTEKNNNIWFGRTVIKSCARLDYATAQNIIDRKVADGESDENIDEALWPVSRRPLMTGGEEEGQHTCYDVAHDVRLMHEVAMKRRKLRFDNGALGLHGIKLTFQLDHQNIPMLCEPYPIRESNKLIEEYMLLANYLVAQRLLTHRKSHLRALLRQHPAPLQSGLDKVVDIARESIGFHIDVSSSETLHDSLCRLERVCCSDNNDEQGKLVLQCITNMLMTPMQAAEYFIVGKNPSPEEWAHFALNIPYYTHFTSPIRRYPDIIVHRLLQETLDYDNDNSSNKNIDTAEQKEREEKEVESLSELCGHCNDRRMSSKYAQDRCDRVFLALYLYHHPLKDIMGIVLSVGKKTFTVFIPSLGIDCLVFLDEHKDTLEFHEILPSGGEGQAGENGKDDQQAPEEKNNNHENFLVEGNQGSLPRLLIRNKKHVVGTDIDSTSSSSPVWTKLEIKIFTKLLISCFCKDQPPIDVRVQLHGPWPTA